MKIGFTLKPNNGNILDFEKQLSHLEEIEAGSAEIPLYELDVISGKKIIKDELNLLNKTIQNSNLQFSIHGSMSVNLLDEEYLSDHLEVLRKEIEVCSALNVNILVTHFGHTPVEVSKNHQKYKDLINIQNEEYFKIAEVAKQNGVKLCIENIFPYTNLHFTALPSEVSKNISEINHPNARTTIDFSHAYINCNLRKKDLISELETIFSTLNIKKDIFFNFELNHRYKKYYSQNIKKAKKLIALIQ